MVGTGVSGNVDWLSNQAIRSHKATRSPEELTLTRISMLFSQPSNFCGSFTEYDVRFPSKTCWTGPCLVSRSIHIPVSSIEGICPYRWTKLVVEHKFGPIDHSRRVSTAVCRPHFGCISCTICLCNRVFIHAIFLARRVLLNVTARSLRLIAACRPNIFCVHCDAFVRTT